MDIVCGNHGKNGFFARKWRWIKEFPNNSLAKLVQLAKLTKKIGQEDPRRVIHSLKVGVALALVSLLYYFKPLYQNFGVSAMWAVMTVVVVLEFSVGGTIGKGLNRGLATLLAGCLGLGAHHLARMTGKVGEPIIIGTLVFLQAVISTFIRFFPKVKARYDYGMLVFMLTFCLVSISGFRTDEILELAHKRLSTIFIGASACVIVSIFICPVWSGQDLHNIVADHIEKLGNYLEGFGEVYFAEASGETGLKDDSKSSYLAGYKSVLNSKTTEENLANLARWEPGHGKFMYCHPWKQYLKIGNVSRQCACRIEALNSYLISEIKAPQEICQIFQDPCMTMCKESGQALKELSLAIRKMTMSSSPNVHIKNSKMAAQSLKSLHIKNSKMASQSLKSLLKYSDSHDDQDNTTCINLREVMPVATVASLLLDVIIHVEDIAECVNELASLAKFRTTDSDISNLNVSGEDMIPKQNIHPMCECSDQHVIIPVIVTATTTTNPEQQEQPPQIQNCK